MRRSTVLSLVFLAKSVLCLQVRPFVLHSGRLLLHQEKSDQDVNVFECKTLQLTMVKRSYAQKSFIGLVIDREAVKYLLIVIKEGRDQNNRPGNAHQKGRIRPLRRRHDIQPIGIKQKNMQQRQCHFAESYFAKYHFAKCYFAECRFVKWHLCECHFAELSKMTLS